MKTTTKPPRGLWFDEGKQRWRVRLYRNGRAYLPRPDAFFEKYDEALAAHTALKAEIKAIPRTRTAVETDLMSLWRQVTLAQNRVRITLHISPENIP